MVADEPDECDGPRVRMQYLISYFWWLDVLEALDVVCHSIRARVIAFDPWKPMPQSGLVDSLSGISSQTLRDCEGLTLPTDSPTVPPRNRIKLRTDVAVAISLRGIAACSAINGTGKSGPKPIAATSNKTT